MQYSKLFRRALLPTVAALTFQIETASCAEQVTLNDLLNAFDRWYLPKLAHSWDNTGLLVEPLPKTQHVIEKIFLTNDLTSSVMDEALQSKCQLVYAYHPPIFAKLKRLTQASVKEKIVIDAIRNDIAIYSPHTRSDESVAGITDWLSSFLSDFVPFTVQPISISSINSGPYESNPFNDNLVHGTGRVVSLERAISMKEVVQQTKKFLDLDFVRVAFGKGKSWDSPISSVAVCCGAGGSIVPKANQVDLYLTGEMSHHEVLAAVENGISVILCEHSNTERGYLKFVKIKIEENFPNCKVVISQVDSDPLKSV